MPNEPETTDPASASRAFGRRILRRVPALEALGSYGLASARADLVAGLTVAAIAVPQSMAYAMVAGLPVEHGLYTAIVMTAVGALFDSSKLLINGPTNAISIALLSAIAATSPEGRVGAAVLLAFLVGVIQLGITLLRLGDLTRYISHSVIVGFTLGASVLLVLDQIKNVVGLQAMGQPHDHFLVRLYLTLTEGGGVRPAALAIGLGTICAVVLLGRLKRRLGVPLLPDLLLVVVGMAFIVARWRLDQHGVRVVGEIPAKLPAFAWPHLEAHRMRDMATPALAVAMLGLLEATSMAKAIAAQTGQRLDMNQQCLSEGVANLAGSFFQCFPGSGSLTRSSINQQAGAVSQWSGVLSAVAVAVIVLALAPAARFIPRAALAGILVVSAFRMVDLRALRYHVRATYFDAAIVLGTAIAAVAISVEFCVLVGIFLSCMLTVPRAGRMRLTEFVVSPEGVVHERLPEDAPSPRLLIFGLEGELFFGAAAPLEEHFDAIEDKVCPETRVVLLRMKRAHNPDAVALTLLDGFLARMKARGVHVLLCGVRKHLHDVLRRTGTAARLDDPIFPEEPIRQTSTLKALEYARTLLDAPVSGLRSVARPVRSTLRG